MSERPAGRVTFPHQRRSPRARVNLTANIRPSAVKTLLGIALVEAHGGLKG